MDNGNESAFPSHGTMGEVAYQGVTKREYFAAMAMQGFCAAPDATGKYTDYARDAVRTADALLAELAKEQP